MSFAENLRAVRVKKNLAQEQLEELLGVSRQTVSKWEQDEGYPVAFCQGLFYHLYRKVTAKTYKIDSLRG